jgi:23S rRNA (guanosine2251-2'-O)-methyltransferase
MGVLAGIHAVRHALSAGESIDALLIEKGKRHPRINELIHLAKKSGVRFSFVPKEALARLAEGASHQGVVARLATTGSSASLSLSDWLNDANMETSPLVLLLDQVTDPHNLGACMRTAEAAGCAAVIIPRDHAADPGSPVAGKAACGAFSRLPLLRVTNISRAINKLQAHGFWAVGLAGEAKTSIYDVELTGALAVVMGSEGAGLRRLVREHCDQLIGIPMPGAVESLNVSVATGVALFEIGRQRAIAKG